MPAVIQALSTQEQLGRASMAAHKLARFSTTDKNALLLAMEEAILADETCILAANQVDLDSSGLTGAMRDRLFLNHERIAAMARGLREVRELPDPVYQTVKEWTRPNGLLIRKLRVPMGVVGVVYESRPNVTVDTVALAIKTSNAIVLRGGKEAAETNNRLARILSDVKNLPEGSIELLDSSTRDSVHDLIKAHGVVDVLIPRGGRELIAFVRNNATVPVIETGEGNCHIFVDETADFEMADRIVINAKTQRPSVCNAMEKLLIHERIASSYLPRIAALLAAQGVEIRGDDETRRLAVAQNVHPVRPEDWSEEYLRLCIAVRVVPSLDEAIAHINRYSSKHSDAIVTNDESCARDFLKYVDSAAVYWNASTRFSDGFEFGFGAEMGISTQKLHCRGPFALEELTTSKYEIMGNGQVRP